MSPTTGAWEAVSRVRAWRIGTTFRQAFPDGRLAIGPNVDLLDLTQDAWPEAFHQTATIALCMALVSHLGDHAVFASHPGQQASFFDGVGQGFLAINVFA